jgi:hypothetical protein
LTHVSKFTNDLVEKDFLVHNNTLLNSAKGKLPALANKNTKFNINNADKLYETRSNIN